MTPLEAKRIFQSVKRYTEDSNSFLVPLGIDIEDWRLATHDYDSPMRKTSTPGRNPNSGDGDSNGEEIEWEMRPGGMLVQSRDDSGPMITVIVRHVPNQYEVFVPSQSTFGDIKQSLLHKTGLQPEEQKLLFRGIEWEDSHQLIAAGVKDNYKVVLVENPEIKEKKVEEVKKSGEASKASQAVTSISSEVDKLADRVSALEAVVGGGTQVAVKEFDVATELLMRELLKLDGIEADGEAKLLRKAEVRRIQKLVDSLDSLKARNSNPVNASKSVAVTTEWEKFDSGMGSLNAPPPMPSSAQLSQDWERFD